MVASASLALGRKSDEAFKIMFGDLEMKPFGFGKWRTVAFVSLQNPAKSLI